MIDCGWLFGYFGVCWLVVVCLLSVALLCFVLLDCLFCGLLVSCWFLLFYCLFVFALWLVLVVT